MESRIVSNKSAAVSPLDNRFFGIFALVITIVVFGGFALNWTNNPNNIARISLWTGLHGAMSAAWYVLLLNQIRLSAVGNYANHKTIGTLSVILVIGILITGPVMAVEFYQRMAGFGVFGVDDAQARLRAGSFLGGAFLQWTLFAVLYVLGVLSVKQPAHHKRFMIAAAIQMMPEGLNRAVHLLALPGYSMFVIMFMVYATLMMYDWKTTKRLHGSTLFSFALFCLLALAMHTVFKWQAWADWIVPVVHGQ